MKKIILLLIIISVFGCCSVCFTAEALVAKTFNVHSESRELPIIADVDVLVIGGTTGGVAAAIAAAQNDAKVFLVAPYPYLGEDMTATLRLWLEPGEKPEPPLALAVYNDAYRDEPAATITRESYPFTYTVKGKINAAHPELKEKPGRLADKKLSTPVTESLQVDENATVIADMDELRELSEIDLVSFFRAGDFQVSEVEYSVSEDGKNWQPLGTVKHHAGHADYDKPISFSLKLEKPISTRYVQAVAKRAAEIKRILLGELFLVPAKEDADATEKPQDDSNRPMFPPPRPLHVKKVLDDALLKANVNFIYSSYAVSALREKGTDRICGVIIQNRQGEQAILAKTIIDATLEYEFVTGAAKPNTLTPFLRTRELPVSQEFGFVTVGGEPQQFSDRYGWHGSYEVMGTYTGRWPNDASTTSGEHKLYKYTLRSNDIAKAWPNIEAKIQAAVYHPDIQLYADKIWQPRSGDHSLLIPETEKNRLGVLYDRNMRPINLIAQGMELGQKFAKTAADMQTVISENLLSEKLQSSYRPPEESISGSIAIVDLPRPIADGSAKFPKLKIPDDTIQRIGQEYDLVVIGGGISGTPAAIAAGRAGMRVLIVEYLHGLGGTGTEGAITNYWWGNRVGFTAEVQDGAAQWVIEQRKQWWRQACLDAGVEMRYGVMGVGAVVLPKERDRVIGVKILRSGLENYVLAKVVIDSTGSGDIAFAAGATPMYINDSEIAVQGAGLPPRELGGRYRNTDYTFVDENDIFDTTQTFVFAKEKFPHAFDLAKILDTRERRRIQGDYVLTVLDQINERTYPDTIVRSRTDFDTHGYTVEPYLEVEHPDRKQFYSYSPYRIHLPRGLKGILVSGLGSSCERDAIPLMRMQPDLQNQGYALGYIAATSIKDGVELRDVDIRKVQRHLVKIGNLPENVLTDIDNYEAKKTGLPEVIKNLPNTDTFDAAHLIFWYPKEGKELVRKAFDDATDQKAKLCYAQVLAVMGDPIGVDLLIEKLKSFEKWDAGWNFKGMGQFGSALSQMDRLVLALGRSGEKRTVPAILDKLALLSHEDDFSHYRACTLALEMLGDPRAVPVLAAALEKPNVRGYAHRSIEDAKKWDQADPKGDTAEQSRRDSLIEIGLARALYRLGDNEQYLGRTVLSDYAENDLRGHFSRHARLVLE